MAIINGEYYPDGKLAGLAAERDRLREQVKTLRAALEHASAWMSASGAADVPALLQARAALESTKD